MRAYLSVQLITNCADLVKSNCAVEKGNMCIKKCRDQNDLCADFRFCAVVNPT